MFNDRLDKVLSIMLNAGEKQSEIIEFLNSISKRDKMNIRVSVRDSSNADCDTLKDYSGYDQNLEYQVGSSGNMLYVRIIKMRDQFVEDQIFDFYRALTIIDDPLFLETTDDDIVLLGSFSTVSTISYDKHLRSLLTRNVQCDDGVYEDDRATIDFYLQRHEGAYYIVVVNDLIQEEKSVPLNQTVVDEVLKPKKRVNIRRV